MTDMQKELNIKINKKDNEYYGTLGYLMTRKGTKEYAKKELRQFIRDGFIQPSDIRGRVLCF